MPLPTTDTTWPPEQFDRAYRMIGEWAAWYSGDPYDIRSASVGASYDPNQAGSLQSWRFWFRKNKTTTTKDGDQRYQLHVPLPGDIASTSADMLFSSPPTLSPPASDAGDVDAALDPTEQDVADPRAIALDELIDNVELHNRLLEAAEICSATGGVFLRAGWDSNLADHPLSSVVTPDSAVPEFNANLLTAVTFWRTLPARTKTESKVYRHLERHERDAAGNGMILHGLYEGTSEKLGASIALDRHEETEGLSESVAVPGGNLAVEYVPNMRPARKLGKLPWGRSDFDGSEQIFDALDETWTSLMRDIRLGKARLIVPREYLDRTGRGDVGTFDIDAEVFSPLEMDPTQAEGVDQVQFKIRVAEHLSAAQELILRAITNAGHSPQSYGMEIDGSAPSGTALRIRERRSAATIARKQRYWHAPVRRHAETLMSIASSIFDAGESFRPDLEWPDSYAPDPTEIATTVQMWDAAAAASTQTKVSTIHPDWTAGEIADEVARIEDQSDVEMPDLFDPENRGTGPEESPLAEFPSDGPDSDDGDDE